MAQKRKGVIYFIVDTTLQTLFHFGSCPPSWGRRWGAGVGLPARDHHQISEMMVSSKRSRGKGVSLVGPFNNVYDVRARQYHGT